MQFLGHGYYIGFLSAAALHGAAHQSPMVMQVVTDAVLRDRQIGSQPVSFIRRAQLERRATLRHIVPTGRINLSTPGVTILDTARSQHDRCTRPRRASYALPRRSLPTSRLPPQ
jgi:predicted transcriptional regulator of viral defense system